MTDHPSTWVFGYGSLIFKADFPYLERKPATIYHWARRFWQGSHDHRGTEASPGRVVTLVSLPDALCKGVAYRIDREVLDHLDFREKNGYRRVTSPLLFEDGSVANGVVYIATEDNPAYLGPASERDIAFHIATSSGPSGTNREYLTSLAQALRDLNDIDDHVFEIESHLLELVKA